MFRRSDLHHSEDVNYLFLVSLADSSHGLCDEGGESPADDDTVHLVSRSWYPGDQRQFTGEYSTAKYVKQKILSVMMGLFVFDPSRETINN